MLPHPTSSAVFMALMAVFNATGGPMWGGPRGPGSHRWGTVSNPCTWAGVCCASNATEWGCNGAQLEQVRGLNLGFNNLVGTLPPDPAVWGALSSLRSLSMRSNALTGTLPPAIMALLPLLEDLNLRRNQLSGTLPAALELPNLRHLSLFTNKLSGTIPASISRLCELGAGAHGGLDLTSNQLRGSIPASISALRNFHAIAWSSGGNVGLGGDGDGNVYECPVPPITLANGTVTASYAHCENATLPASQNEAEKTVTYAPKRTALKLDDDMEMGAVPVVATAKLPANDGLCTTCAAWCAGTCDSFPRPPGVVVNAGSTESVTVFRMTPRNLTDLLDKNTGDALGDIMFTLYEDTVPMRCAQDPSSKACPQAGGNGTNRTGGNTHSWLLDSPLVYAKHVVQTSGEWGPYMHCDVNLSVPFDPEPHFYCRGASPPVSVPDGHLCSACERSVAGMGWKPINSSAANHPRPRPEENATCTATLGRFCNASRADEMACHECWHAHAPALWPLCGGNATHLSREAMDEFIDVWCRNGSAVPAHHGNGRAVFVPSLAAIERSIGGTWFSTGASGQCAPHEVPSKRPGGCKWKITSTTLKNYSCVNTNLARAVRASNMSCFAGCPDGHLVYPGPWLASDCWQTCFFGAILGLPFDNTEVPPLVAPLVSAEDLEAAWVAAIKDDVMCPPLPPSEPPPPESAAAAAASSWRPPVLYSNPVVNTNSPDPGVLGLEDGRYVAVTSSGFSIDQNIFPIRESTDLVHWRQTGYIFPTPPRWALPPFYAPEIHGPFAGPGSKARYWAVYDALEAATGSMAVGAAWALHPTGPFTDLGAPLQRAVQLPRGLAPRNGSAIDATLWQNHTDGAIYLLWKNKLASTVPGHTGVRQIVVQQLRMVLSPAPALVPVGSAQIVLLASEPWEAHDVEGPFLWQEPSQPFVYLFYSGSNTWGTTYAVGVARATSIRGPFSKLTSGPVAHSRHTPGSAALSTNTTWVSPGHNSVVRKGERSYLVYHANRWREAGVNCTRYMMVDRLTWSLTGWPQLGTADGAPSDLPRPVPEAEQRPATLSSARRQCSAVASGGLAIFAGGYTHGMGNSAGSSGKAVDMFDRRGVRVATAELSVSRGTMGAASWCDLAFFGGGQDEHKNNTAALDIFNVTSGTRHTQNLSQARAMVAAVTVGDLIFFAGGELAESESGQGKSKESSRVDIWNASAGCWHSHVDALSIARKKMGAASAGGKAIFAGGYSEQFHESVGRIDIYDTVTQTWSHSELSSSRMRLQAVSLTAQDGTEYALFIGGLGKFSQPDGTQFSTGGLCTTVDIYNARTGEWTFTNMTRGRYEFAAAAVGHPNQDAVIISGGKQGGVGPQPWNLVEMFNVSTKRWSWIAAPYGWSYNAGVGLPGTSAAIFGGGDFQNGTTTNFTDLVNSFDVVTPPHPPTYFPDMKAPPHLLVVSMLPDKNIRWPEGCTVANVAPCVSELVMLGSLAGHSVRYNGPLGLVTEAVPDHRVALDMLVRTAVANTATARLHVTVEYAASDQTALTVGARVLGTLAKVTRYVLCDISANPQSLNAAKMQAWNFSAVVIDKPLEKWAQAHGLTLAMDVSTMTDARILREWAPTWTAPHNLGIEQLPGPWMVDYTVATGALTWYTSGTPASYNDTARNQFLSLLQPGSSILLGAGCPTWFEEDTACTTAPSSHGVLMEPSQKEYSLLTFGGYHHHSHFPFAQKAQQKARRPALPPPGVHTVTFVLSASPSHWLSAGWLSKVWNSPCRGRFPIAMGFNSAERDLSQPLVEYLYENATVNDSFVAMCPAGNAILDHLSPEARRKTATTLAGYMADMDMSVLVGFADTAETEVWTSFLAERQIDAAFHWVPTKCYTSSSNPNFANVMFVNDKPVVRGRISLWATTGTIDSELAGINKCGSPQLVARTLNSMPKTNDPQSGFSMVPVRMFGNGSASLMDISRTIDLLDPDVEVVSPNEFVQRLQHARTQIT